MMRGVRVGAWSDGERPAPEPVLDGISFYLEGVPAGTVLLGTTGRVYSESSPVVVDWGDGTKSTIAYATVMRIPTHTYEVGGDYVINITGEDITQINAYSGIYWPVFTEKRAYGLPYIKKFTISRDYPINLGTASNTAGHLFRDCSGLSEVRLGAVKILGSYCFYGCSSLTSVTIPSSVTSLGDSCFRNCTGLTSVTIPSGIASLSNYCFYLCSGLSSVKIPSSVTKLGTSCFDGCTGLTSVDIPSSVTSLGIYCFRSCTGLTSVTIPSGVTAVGGYCFSGCSGLTSVTIPSSVTSIGINCFSGCIARIDFYGTTGRTSSVDADDLLGECEVHVHQEIVPEYLFKGVTSQFDLVIEDSVTELGKYCFYGCTGLTSIDIPSSVTNLGSYCLGGCTGLTSMTVRAIEPPKSDSTSFDGLDPMMPVYVPAESVSTYRDGATSGAWKLFFKNYLPIPD